ncbi:MAG TPA: chromate resistance protein ChrB domain-containing protein [Candidatus Dormibacteraeota bacterium]|nr:chromate resistance protein ChrB domain-containing protein [Candidatus Dormibacteraeota bacterium]
MKWITRQNASVDRIACPWLVRRFIDPAAEFLYVPAADVAGVAEREGAIPYDVAGVELGHVDGRCSFESIILKYGLHDPALDRLAQIVHGADVTADLELSPEAAGLKAIAHGFALVHGVDDHRKLDLETPLYDALYAWCQHELGKLSRA